MLPASATHTTRSTPAEDGKGAVDPKSSGRTPRASLYALVGLVFGAVLASPAAALLSQTITFTNPGPKTYGVAPFALVATATSGLPVSFASLTLPVCTVNGTTATIVAAGTCSIQASQAGNTTYAAAPNVNQTFTVAKSAQTITFGALAPKTYGNVPFTVGATVSSGLAVTFVSTTLTVCTVSTATVTILTAGTCTIQARQAGNGNYLAATSVNQSFTVAKAAQTITFGALAGLRLDQTPLTVSATASSGLVVTFTSTTGTICTVSGTTVTLKLVGTCTIQANQAGNTNYLAAPAVNRSFAVFKGNQTITFNALANKAFGSGTFAVSATASSALVVTFTSTTTLICTISGVTVTLKAAGTCTIQAAQAGNANWNAAISVPQSFTVTKGSQTITFNVLGNRALGSGNFGVNATATSGLAVSFSSLTTTVCTVSGTTVTLVAVGACTIQANQAGNINYLAAPAVNQSFNVTPGSQTITFPTIGPRLWGDAPFAVSASSSSGLPVAFLAQTPATCSISGSTVTLLGVGSCVVLAVQGGNANYNAASSSQSFKTLGPVDFAAPVLYPVIGTQYSAGIGDFGADGKLDLAVVNSDQISILGGNGDGTLTPITTYAAGAASRYIAVADFNGDGRSDIAYANPADNTVAIRLGYGNNAFGAPIAVSVASSPTALAVADVNNDGKPDLVVTNGATTSYSSNPIGGTTVQIFLGNGDGTFRAPTRFGAVGSPVGVAIADFNGDGKPDVAVINLGYAFTILLGNGDGTFATGASFATTSTPMAVAAADLNGDGKVDLAIVQAGTLTIYQGLGDGTFSAPLDVGTGGAWVAGIAIGDFTGDGTPDIVTTSIDVVIVPGIGDGTFLPGILIDAGVQASGVAAGDLNGDGRLDLVVTSDQWWGANAHMVSVLLNTGVAGTTYSVTTQSGTPQSANVNATYATAFSVLVRNGAGQPMAGQDVVWIAPTIGASGTFSGSGVLAQSTTNGSGVAIAPSFVANGLAGSFTVVASSGTASAPFYLTNQGTSSQAPVFVSGPLPNGTVSLPYSYTVSATGTPAPTISALPGSLPAGLTLNGSTGLVNGTPTTPATYVGNLTASNGVLPDATQAFAVVITLNTQVITFATLPNLSLGAPPFTVSATASSGLPVVFTSLSAPVCTISGTTVTVITLGTCTIQAGQGGNATYAAAPNVSRSFTVSKVGQTITFGALFNRNLGSAPFAVSATTSSGLAVTFSSTTAATCTLAGTTVTLIATGTCTVRAAQSGNATYAAAAVVDRSFTVKPAGADQAPTIAFTTPSNNSTYVAPAIIPLLATAADPDGTIVKVEFYNGSSLLGTATTAPYRFVWTNVATGTYVLTAKGYDDLGVATTSTAVTVVVNATGSPIAFAAFHQQVSYSTFALGRGDFNGDGKLDVVFTDSERNVIALKGDGHGRLAGASAATTGPNCFYTLYTETVVADFNGDGKPDIGLSSTNGCVAIVLNNGDGTLRTGNDYPVTSVPVALAGGDFNGDGRLDVAVISADGTLSLFFGNGDGTLQPPTTIAAAPASGSIAAGDFNGDGKLDLAVTDLRDNSLLILLGTGTGTFQSPRRIGLSGGYGYYVAVGDLNGDGKLDLALSDYYRGVVTILIGNGDATFQPPVDYPAGVSPNAMAVADLNGDGMVDLAIANSDWTSTVSILLGNGNGTFRAPVTIPVGVAPSHIAVGDLDGDGKPDLIVQGQYGVSTLINITGAAASAPTFTNGPPPGGLANAPYNFTFTAGGVPASIFTMTSILPADGRLMMGTDGLLTSGAWTPARGVYNGTVVASNGIAPDATLNFSIAIAGASQTITFGALNNKTLGDPAFIPSATASSGYNVTFVSLTASTCTVSGGIVTLIAAGTCAVRASQAGSAAFAPAPDVDRSFTVAAPLPPVVTLTAPLNNSSFASPVTITMTANASTPNPGGWITKVEFYRGSVLLGTDTTSPYSFAWANATLGSYPLSAKAYDNRGATTLSAAVNVSVTSSNTPPIVSLTAPLEGQSFVAPATINLTATASDAGGTVAKVQFFANATLISTATSAPYVATWSNVASGSYTLTAEATDNGNAVTTSAPVHITVAVPGITLSAPVAGTAYGAGQSIVMTAQAATPGHTLSRVEFSADGAVLGSVTIPGGLSAATVNFTWSGAAIGAHTLGAKAIATDGFTVISPTIGVTVTDLAVTLAEPYAGQVYVAPSAIRISANPTEAGAIIARVDFYGDGALMGSRTVPPYTWVWNGAAIGAHTVSARVRDGAGLTATSATVSVSMLGAPTVQLGAGIDGATVGDDNVTVSGTVQAPLNSAVIVNGKATALDRNGQFFVDNIDLQPGTNTLTLLFYTQDGTLITKTITVNSSGVAPFTVTMDPQEGLAPLDAAMVITSRGNVAFQRIEVDTNDDGTAELTLNSLTNGEAQLTLNYPSPGIYTVRVTVFNASNQVIYLARRKVRAIDPLELAANVGNVFLGMLDKLGTGNITGALNAVSGGARDKYQAIFNSLQPDLATIVSRLGTIQRITVTDNLAKLGITRDSTNGPQTFQIYLIRSEDGIRRVDGM